ETESGMGLIDAHGNYIIEPKYQIVEFDHRTGLSRVKLDEEWRWLDYEGREVSDVGDVSDCPARTAAGCSPRS
ncbi:MAG: WG repeat-containing protein, partial [Rikenellaceae bacterium]